MLPPDLNVLRTSKLSRRLPDTQISNYKPEVIFCDCRVRTSSGMFLIRGQDNIVRTIEERIARYTMIPVENGEGFQVLQYESFGLKICSPLPVLKEPQRWQI